MRQCRGKTKAGNRCKKLALAESHHCSIHKSEDTGFVPSIVGAICGNILFPGIGGLVGGAVVGALVGNKIKENKMSKPKVFVSFDYDHDETLKTFLIGQSKLQDSPFEISDWSIKEHITGDWKAKARTRIKRSDQVVVICGMNTNKATGVSEELKIAQEENTPYFLLNGYKSKTCVKPKAAKGSDKVYKWTWDNLKSLIGGAR